MEITEKLIDFLMRERFWKKTGLRRELGLSEPEARKIISTLFRSRYILLNPARPKGYFLTPEGIDFVKRKQDEFEKEAIHEKS